MLRIDDSDTNDSNFALLLTNFLEKCVFCRTKRKKNKIPTSSHIPHTTIKHTLFYDAIPATVDAIVQHYVDGCQSFC